MNGILKAFLGVTNANIQTLTDAQAIKANIMTNLKSMVADAKNGKYSYLVFRMSSHGTQVPDANGDELGEVMTAHEVNGLSAGRARPVVV